ncbi:ABC transporter ATP-binding protein [Lacticaseibacillus parakribbianus]|uniref:ABC transporter ATP-binding protein n=1 Tax=Lacticaseibacillus parakribbianus TaxID=2970927 RepID=UPI0021CB90AB|nr:ABC transporter ATP-binding protein [Lacticaseibacillus parakribbianus]
MTGLGAFLRREWRLSLRATAWVVASAALNVLYTVTSGNALTQLSHRNASGFLQALGLTLLVLGGFAWQRYATTVTQAQVNEQVATDVRQGIAGRLAATTPAVFHRHGVPTYLSWLTNDVSTIQEYGLENFWLALWQVLTVVMATVTLWRYHYSLALAALVLTGLMLVAPRPLTPAMNRTNLATTEANSALTTALTDRLNGFDQLALLNRSEQLTTAATQQSQYLRKARVAYARATGRLFAVTNGASFLCQLAILALTGWLFLSHRVPLGTFVTAETLSGSLFSSLTGLAANVAEIKTVAPILAKFTAVPVPPRPTAPLAGPLQHALCLTNIHYTYPDAATPVLAGVSYRFAAGGHYAIVGESGSGKSTLLAVLAGLIEPQAGRYTFDDQDVATVAPAALRAQIALVTQQPVLFNLTLRENLTLGQPVAAAALAKAMQDTGLDRVVATLPKGLETRLDLAGANLSGGQKQRIALTRALLSDRPILLLDEALANLDPASTRQVEAALLALPNRTEIWVTHHLSPQTAALMSSVITVGKPRGDAATPPGGEASGRRNESPAAGPIAEPLV